MRMLQENGINAYLQGCLVATFPERQHNLPTQTKVFFVDPQAGIKDYIPDSLLEDYEFFSHDFYIHPTNGKLEKEMYEFGRKTIDRYAKEAKLIVTSKYHAAIIALALGIPVILIMENDYYKYSWLKKFIPVYEPKDFQNIDWNPQPVVISREEKELMVKIAKDRIAGTYQTYEELCKLSEMKETVEVEEFDDIFYGSYAIEYIKENWKKDEMIEYTFWGATETAVKLNRFIYRNYPNARLIKIFDWSIRNPVFYEEGSFVPEPLENIELLENVRKFMFVTGNSASLAAKELFLKIGKKNYFLCERKILMESDLKKDGE